MTLVVEKLALEMGTAMSWRCSNIIVGEVQVSWG
jgi:hypothetical protein